MADKQGRKEMTARLRKGETLYAVNADRVPGVCIELGDDEALIITKPKYIGYNQQKGGSAEVHLRLGDVVRN